MSKNKKNTIILVVLALLMISSSFAFVGCTKAINGEESEQDVDGSADKTNKGESVSRKLLNKKEDTIATRYNPPKGFKRVGLEGKSFGQYLRGQKLKPYNDADHVGGVYDGVLKLEIDIDNAHQTAAMMLLRAEYLYKQERYDEIVFKFESGTEAAYENWMNGSRIDKQGGVIRWVDREGYSNKPADLRNFMNAVFTYSEGLGLEKELKSVELEDISIGDLFIRGGGHGQAVMVIDMAKNDETGEKVIMLAQGSLFAEETRILLNPNNPEINPWYSLDFEDALKTPEGKFVKSDLKGFE